MRNTAVARLGRGILLLLAACAPAAPQGSTPEPAPVEVVADPTSPPATLSGTGADAARGAPVPEPRPDVAALLERYLLPPGEFAWSARLRAVGPKFAIYDLTFPSPVPTEYPENNTVHCEWYHGHTAGKRPSVVVLHILDGRFYASRLICTGLATAGLDAMLVKLPFYGPRRPAGVPSPARDLKLFELLVRQGVADTRRAAALLAGLPTTENGRVDLCGISLGGFVGALTAGVDGNFGRAAFALAGGGLAEVIGTGARETRKLKACFAEAGITGEKLRAWLEPIDPLTFAHRLEPCDMVMFNVTGDEVVPESSARALAKAAGNKPVTWYEAKKHTDLLKHLGDVLRRNRAHFTKP